MIFAGILGGDQTKQKKIDLFFLQNFSASSSRNHSRAAKSFYAGRMRPAKRGLGSLGLDKLLFKGGESSSQFQWFTIDKIEL